MSYIKPVVVSEFKTFIRASYWTGPRKLNTKFDCYYLLDILRYFYPAEQRTF